MPRPAPRHLIAAALLALAVAATIAQPREAFVDRGAQLQASTLPAAESPTVAAK